MEKFDPERFKNGIRALKRELGQGIIDKKQLYEHTQTHADEENEALRAKIRERNLRYVEQRRRKQENNMLIDTHSTFQYSKGFDIETPSERNFIAGNRTSRSYLSSGKLAPLSPTFASNLKKSKYSVANNNTSLETNDQTTSINQTKQTVQFPATKKPEEKFAHTDRHSTTHRLREMHDFSLSSHSIGNSFRSPLPQLSDLQTPRMNGIKSPFEREKSRREMSLNARYLKKFISAKRMLDVVKVGSRDLALSTQRKEFTEDEKLKKTKQFVEEYYRNMIDMLGSAYDTLALAIQARKDKVQLDRHLNEVLNYAQKSHNIEIYITALKTQAKILIKFKDLYRSIGNFKAITRIADSNNDFKYGDTVMNKNYLHHKLSSYKNLGKCFQEIQNYKKATFYFVKMLQTAWLLKDTRKELLAYDMIGLQYYYLGEMEHANYYHQKLMNGAVEKVGSELRELGIQKLLTNIEDKAQNKGKHKDIKSVEEELTSLSNPASEDEFELSEPLVQNAETSRKKEASFFNSTRRVKLIPLLMEQKKSMKPRKLQKTEPSKTDVTKLVFESIAHPPKPAIYLSHLSPNRFLKNFHSTDTKDIINAYVNTETLYGDRVRSVTLDRQGLEDVHKILEQFRKNLLVVKLEVEKMLASHPLLEILPPALKSNSKLLLSEKA